MSRFQQETGANGSSFGYSMKSSRTHTSNNQMSSSSSSFSSNSVSLIPTATPSHGSNARAPPAPATSSSSTTSRYHEQTQGREVAIGRPGDEESTTAQADLLRYYRDRCEQYDQERKRLLERFSNLEVQHEELDRLRWQLQVREEEIKELQKALSDANSYLYDEREHVLKLQAENEQLKVQEIEDRKRIQHLLALAQPVTQEVTFFRDCRPEKLQSGGNTDNDGKQGAKQHHMETAAGVYGDPPSGKQNPTKTNTSERILRTVYLPSDQAEALVKKVEALDKQLQSANELSEQRKKAWEEDRERNRKAAENREKDLKERVQQLEKDLKAARESSRDATKDMLEAKQKADEKTREAAESNRDLRNERDQLREELARARASAQEEVEAVKESSEREIANLKAEAYRITQQRDDDLKVLQDQYQQVQQNYEDELSKTREHAESLRKKYADLKRRRALDMEGFTNDVIQLRRALRQLETQWALIGEAVRPVDFEEEPHRLKEENGNAEIRSSGTTERKHKKGHGAAKSNSSGIPSGVYYRASHAAHAQPLQTGTKAPHDTVARAKGGKGQQSVPTGPRGKENLTHTTSYFVGETPDEDEDVNAVVKEAWNSQRLNEEMGRLRRRINYLENNAKHFY
eukprot:gb/GECG01001505.1/.p1 GENE.gb/GECG01001505.1/~~gb/GECG01001505.1/.p1  ORF type:complete len:632 (+),score=126.70 gb/GECG01001505.1/:1-1896(+)